MKYIRTKAGKIYDLIDLRVEEKLNGNPYVETSSGWVIYKTSIVQQADNIEELCDEFVCLENKMTFHDLETITSSSNLKHLTVYGAIWTDKGLIYVAKMNEKGELELS